MNITATLRYVFTNTAEISEHVADIISIGQILESCESMALIGIHFTRLERALDR